MGPEIAEKHRSAVSMLAHSPWVNQSSEKLSVQQLERETKIA